jgi:hypothetical protein
VEATQTRTKLKDPQTCDGTQIAISEPVDDDGRWNPEVSAEHLAMLVPCSGDEDSADDQ